MGNRGTVTVVVPLFNKVSTVDRCITSILTQTRRPDQILIVDDCSTDGSASHVRDRFSGMVELLILRRNEGPGAARNAGAALAKTEWIAFLDADDQWAPRYLETMMEAVAAEEADYAGCCRMMIYKTRSIVRRFGDGSGATISLNRVFWGMSTTFLPLSSSSVVIKRELFERAGAFPTRLRRYEDFALWSEVWFRGSGIFVDKELVTIHKDDDGLSNQWRSFRQTLSFTFRLMLLAARSAAVLRPGTAALVLYCFSFFIASAGSYVKQQVLSEAAR